MNSKGFLAREISSPPERQLLGKGETKRREETAGLRTDGLPMLQATPWIQLQEEATGETS